MPANLGIANLVLIFVVLVVAITLHEAMHAFAGHWLGDDTAHQQGRLSLNPLRHVDLYSTIILPLVTLILFKVPLLAAKPVPFNPNRVRHGEYGAAMVGMAGPLTNLLLAVVATVIGRLLLGSLPDGVVTAFAVFIEINVALFVFNMIPIPPLDGSRLLYAFAPEPIQEIMAGLERWGIVIIFGLVLAVPAFGTLLVNLNNEVLRLLLG